jgi:hypothetical protein
MKRRFNGLHPNIIFNFDFSETAEFLDLMIYKGPRFQRTGHLDLKVHQKVLNLYLYIPFISFHPRHQFRGLIKTELIRYVRNCSDIDSYIDMKRKFFSRLKSRGYPTKFLRQHYNIVRYQDRNLYLQPTVSEPRQMIPFVLDYNSTTQELRRDLSRKLEESNVLLESSGLPRPLITFRNPPNLLSQLCSNRESVHVCIFSFDN